MLEDSISAIFEKSWGSSRLCWPAVITESNLRVFPLWMWINQTEVLSKSNLNKSSYLSDNNKGHMLLKCGLERPGTIPGLESIHTCYPETSQHHWHSQRLSKISQREPEVVYLSQFTTSFLLEPSEMTFSQILRTF